MAFAYCKQEIFIQTKIMARVLYFLTWNKYTSNVWLLATRANRIGSQGSARVCQRPCCALWAPLSCKVRQSRGYVAWSPSLARMLSPAQCSCIWIDMLGAICCFKKLTEYSCVVGSWLRTKFMHSLMAVLILCVTCMLGKWSLWAFLSAFMWPPLTMPWRRY